MVFGLIKYGNFHNNKDKIGVEIETGLVNASFQKPLETNPDVAVKNYLEFVISQSEEAMSKTKGKTYKKYADSVQILKLYKNLLTNPDFQISTSKIDFVRAMCKDADAFMRLGLKYCIPDFQGFVQDVFRKSIENKVEDRGLGAIIKIVDSVSDIHKIKDLTKKYKSLMEEEDQLNKEFQFYPTLKDGKLVLDLEKILVEDSQILEKLKRKQEVSKQLEKRFDFINRDSFISSISGILMKFIKPLIESQVAITIGSAYSSKLLDTYQLIIKKIPKELQEKITYDASDALEMITTPVSSVAEVREQLISDYETIKPILKELGLKNVFSARLPNAEPMGWKKVFGRSEPQNVFGLHIHYGKVKDEFEAAAVYEAFRRVAPELLALTANSGVSSSKIVDSVCERQNLYRNIIPPAIDVKPNMTWNEQRKLREQMKKIFGENSKFERGDQYSSDSDIEKLLIKKGISLGKKSKEEENLSARGNSCVYVRPELGTIEIRMVDVQSDYNVNSLEAHIDANMQVVELIEAIGDVAVQKYREGQEFITEVNGLEERYDRAINKGLSDEEINSYAKNLINEVQDRLEDTTKEIFKQRIVSRESPAVKQKQVFAEFGLEGLFNQITTL